MADPNGDLTGDDVIYVYPDYHTLLVGKFKKSVMIKAKRSFVREILFDDISGIPYIIPGEILNPEEIFHYDEADETTISMNPLLQGLNILFAFLISLKVYLLTYHLKNIMDDSFPRAYVLN